jgi:hypothetical protein
VDVLPTAVRCVGHRQTSRTSDETICLSTILGMDPKQYLDIGGDPDDVVERRMESFLKEIGKFNADLIFSSYQRLKRTGFRWAPRSLLGSRTSSLGAIGDQQIARLRRIWPFSGLVVRYPGFKCKLGPAAKLFSTTGEKTFAISVEGRERSSTYYSAELKPQLNGL